MQLCAFSARLCQMSTSCIYLEEVKLNLIVPNSREYPYAGKLIKYGGNFNYLLISHWSAVSRADEVNPVDKYPF